MIDYNNVKEYIENKNGMELTFMQKQILKAIIRGDIIYTARGIGRSMLYNGYADYLKEKIGKDTDRTIKNTDYDSIFTASMLTNDDIIKGLYLKDIKNICSENYDREFECKLETK